MRELKKQLRHMEGLDLACVIAEASLEKQAEDLVILDVRGIATFTDFFVIMSGRSTRHVRGLAEAIDAALAKKRIKGMSVEGLKEGLWALLDYSDVVVHIFYAETRQYYDLERLWHDGARVEPTECKAVKKGVSS